MSVYVCVYLCTLHNMLWSILNGINVMRCNRNLTLSLLLPQFADDSDKTVDAKSR